MLPLRRTFFAALAIAGFVIACGESKTSVGPKSGTLSPSDASYTASVGSKSTLIGRATFSDDNPNFNVKRKTDDWQMEIKSKGPFDMAVQTIVFQPGGQSGWHTHPGPVFIQVLSGTMTFYMSDDPTCTPMVRTAGQSYVDIGEHPHIARNEGTAVATNLVTYFAPPGAALRIDADAPGNCSF